MQTMMSFVFVIISAFLYFAAPMNYSWDYCNVCAIFYIINAVLGIKPVFKKYTLSFSLFFTLALFACTYLFPLFVYNFNDSYSLFSFGYDPNVITKCTAMVNLAHSMYWLGVVRNQNKYYKRFIIKNITINDNSIILMAKIVISLFVLILLSGGLSFYTDRYQVGEMSINLFFQYVNVLFSTFSITLACMLIFANKMFTYRGVYILLGIIAMIILSTGSRTLPMFLFLPLVFVYKQRNNVSLMKLTLISIVLLFVFMAIGHLRNESITLDSLLSYDINSSSLGYIDNFQDFIVCNRNLYSIYSFVEKDGILYGNNFLSSFLSIIPFAQNIVSNLFNIPYYELDSSVFCTYLVFGNNPPLGLGTHIVGDVYLATGLPGVIILFYLLGKFVVKVRNGAFVSKNNFLLIVYLYMLSYSVFICRGSFFGAVKGVVWSAMILFLINEKLNYKYKNIRVHKKMK